MWILKHEMKQHFQSEQQPLRPLGFLHSSCVTLVKAVWKVGSCSSVPGVLWSGSTSLGSLGVFLWVFSGSQELPVFVGKPRAHVCTNLEPPGRFSPMTRDHNRRRPWALRLSAQLSVFGCIWWVQNEGGQTWAERPMYIQNTNWKGKKINALEQWTFPGCYR